MHVSPQPEPGIDPLLWACLMDQADDQGTLSFRDYMATVLYHPEAGYYCSNRERVGRRESTDFFTAIDLGKVFYPLLHSAAVKLLNKHNPKDFTWVEIGNEPGQETSPGPFGQVIQVPLGAETKLPEKCILFANEILDAQPFFRFIFKGSQWHEYGVKLLPDNQLQEVIRPKPDNRAADFLATLPDFVGEGYQLDIALDTEAWLESWFASSWQGLVLLIDYGRSRQELLEACPSGTARGYYRHKRIEDVLRLPGRMDLTCDVCWDRVESIVAKACSRHQLERQEAFFMHHAHDVLEELMTTTPQAMGTLRELIHPAMMGHRFQVLWGVR